MISKDRNKIIFLQVFLGVFFCINGTFGQYGYNTPNDICGGWFKSSAGSIKFNFTLPKNDNTILKNQVCVWTINPVLPNQYDHFTLTVKPTSNLTCDRNHSISFSHFSLRSKDVTASETWNCGAPLQLTRVPGTVIVIILIAPQLKSGTGFTVEWKKGGDNDRMNRTVSRTSSYNFGKPNMDPIPYYAAGFTGNEISTHAFARGNNTDPRFRMQMSFEDIKFVCSEPESPETGNYYKCKDGTDKDENQANHLLVCSIQGDGTLEVEKLYSGQGYLLNPLGDPIQTLYGQNGIFILVWMADYWGSGGSFQLVYRMVI